MQKLTSSLGADKSKETEGDGIGKKEKVREGAVVAPRVSHLHQTSTNVDPNFIHRLKINWIFGLLFYQYILGFYHSYTEDLIFCDLDSASSSRARHVVGQCVTFS
jgi:hypothetical protein